MSDDPYLDRLNSLNRKAEVTNALNAAQLVQQQRIIQLNKDLLGVEKQRLAEERTYRFKMWQQSPDGSSFSNWCTRAAALVAAIRTFDEQWRDAWRHEYDAMVSPEERAMVSSGRYLAAPRSVAAKRLVHPLLIVALVVVMAVLVLGSSQSGFGPKFWIALVLLATTSGALAWALLFDDSTFRAQERAVEEQFRARRIAHFGLDPITDPSPTWSVNNEHVEIDNNIERAIKEAPVALPAPHELPALRVPRCVDASNFALHSQRTLLATNFFHEFSSDAPDEGSE